MRKVLLFSLLALIFATSCTTSSYKGKKVLIYTKNGEGYVHDNIAASVVALEKICKAEGIETQVSDDPSLFTSENLAAYDALIFSNTNNEAFDTDEQRKAFQEFIRSGKGFVAIHSANASERDWPWYRAMVGGKFLRHPPYQEFEVLVTDPGHPSTDMLPSPWVVNDECYYSNYFNPAIRVLLSANLATVEDPQREVYPGVTFGDQLPLCWTNHFEGGKQWYTALGHDSAFYSDPLFVAHLRGGILWAIK